MDILAELRSRFGSAIAAFATEDDSFLSMIRPAQDARFGDFQANMAMPLAKLLSKPPREVASEIVSRLDVADLCDSPEVAGPGFINLRVRADRLAQETSRLVADKRLGVVPVAEPRTVVVDFSSPNVAKPMHVGHLRSTVIGDALVRVYRFLGHRAISDNHIGDWGTQFGMILYGYKHLLDRESFEREPVAELSRLYRLVNQLSEYHTARAELPELERRIAAAEEDIASFEAALDPKDKDAKKRLGKLRNELTALREEQQFSEAKRDAIEHNLDLKALADAHPKIAVEARLETAKLHSGDPDNTELWRRFLPACLDALHRVYDRLGVTFDEELGESYYQPLLASVVDELASKGLASESDGATCVFNEGFTAPFIVRKADGAFLYATTDLATIKYRIEQWQAQAMLYVVDKRQSDHFEQLFVTAHRWGYDDVVFKHVSFGTILGDDKKPFKTRSGDTVGLESLLDEAVERAYRIVSEGDDAKPDGPELPEEERCRIAEIVGLGGIKYADLKHNRDSDYVFSWDKMLSTTGDTATYMQYAYARVNGIARRGGVDAAELRAHDATVSLDAPEERALALQLNRFAEAIDGVVRDDRPNVLTDYLFSLAGAFTSFYDKCPVLKAETAELRRSRLVLCDLTARTIAKGLNLLGIAVSERM
ncbi:MAG: arginine--tRNA ligase [Planctomycetota bacterium]|nr:arginine--tRNA ligase [Planctomycetaceae bacterium]MDQ3332467.1 arginine--tRNA ligase [Planctomycetota bacterium]